jgi:translocator protein
MNFKRLLPLGLFLLLAFAAAGLGALATATSVDTWFPTLRKPSWNPPPWVFSPVWTLLYILMAIATWRAWSVGDAFSARRTASLYSAQLTLNALWSILFFGMRRPDIALAEIFVLLAVLIVILVRYWRIDRVAAALWLPYVAWVSFATALNAAIWSLNR